MATSRLLPDLASIEKADNDKYVAPTEPLVKPALPGRGDLALHA